MVNGRERIFEIYNKWNTTKVKTNRERQ